MGGIKELKWRPSVGKVANGGVVEWILPAKKNREKNRKNMGTSIDVDVNKDSQRYIGITAKLQSELHNVGCPHLLIYF